MTTTFTLGVKMFEIVRRIFFYDFSPSNNPIYSRVKRLRVCKVPFDNLYASIFESCHLF